MSQEIWLFPKYNGNTKIQKFNEVRNMVPEFNIWLDYSFNTMFKIGPKGQKNNKYMLLFVSILANCILLT